MIFFTWRPNHNWPISNPDWPISNSGQPFMFIYVYVYLHKRKYKVIKHSMGGAYRLVNCSVPWDVCVCRHFGIGTGISNTNTHAHSSANSTSCPNVMITGLFSSSLSSSLCVCLSAVICTGMQSFVVSCHSSSKKWIPFYLWSLSRIIMNLTAAKYSPKTQKEVYLYVCLSVCVRQQPGFISTANTIHLIIIKLYSCLAVYICLKLSCIYIPICIKHIKSGKAMCCKMYFIFNI